MRTCRAAPPRQTESVEPEQSPDTTDEEGLGAPMREHSIVHSTHSSSTLGSMEGSAYDQNLLQGANPDQLFERPLHPHPRPEPVAIAQPSQFYPDLSNVAGGSSSGWAARDVRSEDSHYYTQQQQPQHTYTAQPAQPYLPRLDTQPAVPFAQPYNNPIYSPTALESPPSQYPLAQYHAYSSQGISPVQSYARAEAFTQAPSTFTYDPPGPTLHTQQQLPYVSTSHQSQAYYSGEPPQPQQFGEHSQQPQSVIRGGELWQGTNPNGSVHYYRHGQSG